MYDLIDYMQRAYRVAVLKVVCGLAVAVLLVLFLAACSNTTPVTPSIGVGVGGATVVGNICCGKCGPNPGPADCCEQCGTSAKAKVVLTGDGILALGRQP